MSETNIPLPIGTLFRRKREEKGLLVRQVAAVIEADQAIISRIENNDRYPTREQVVKLSGLYGLDQQEMLSVWLAGKMVKQYGEEPFAPEAFKEARSQIINALSLKKDRENS